MGLPREGGCPPRAHALGEARRSPAFYPFDPFMATTFVWRKRVAPPRADFWAERLATAVGPARLVVIENPRAAHLEVCCADAAEAAGLVTRFGGATRAVPDADWQTPAPAATAARPLRIGRRLLVTGAEDEVTLSALRARHPGRAVLSIPAAMAFGTGEHATTAMCLRFLDEQTRGRPPGSWDALDLGTGSGAIALSIAAERRDVEVVGVERSGDALVWTRRNVGRLRLPNARVVEGDLADAVPEWDGAVDVVVAGHRGQRVGQPLLDVTHHVLHDVIGSMAIRSRRVASARITWLRTVPEVQPRIAAIEPSSRSS